MNKKLIGRNRIKCTLKIREIGNKEQMGQTKQIVTGSCKLIFINNYVKFKYIKYSIQNKNCQTVFKKNYAAYKHTIDVRKWKI